MNRYFRFFTNSRGMVVLAGLSPAETFELEDLLFGVKDPASQARLDALCAKHCRAARLQGYKLLPERPMGVQEWIF